jgi:hypothetical protein
LDIVSARLLLTAEKGENMIGRQNSRNQARLDNQLLSRLKQFDTRRHYPGHTHFWDRALSRRHLVQSAGVAIGMLGSAHWKMANAAVPGDFPKPIPGGFTFPGVPGTFHNTAPGVFDPLDTDRSSVFDFNGHLGYAVVDGAGTGRNTQTDVTTRLDFETDLRFMQGVYVGTDGKHRNATFAFL